MHAFYTRLDQFLVAAGLERSTLGLGCSEAEIVAQEQTYGVRFPLAYWTLIGWFSRGRFQRLKALFSSVSS